MIFKCVHFIVSLFRVFLFRNSGLFVSILFLSVLLIGIRVLFYSSQNLFFCFFVFQNIHFFFMLYISSFLLSIIKCVSCSVQIVFMFRGCASISCNKGNSRIGKKRMAESVMMQLHSLRAVGYSLTFDVLLSTQQSE